MRQHSASWRGTRATVKMLGIGSVRANEGRPVRDELAKISASEKRQPVVRLAYQSVCASSSRIQERNFSKGSDGLILRGQVR